MTVLVPEENVRISSRSPMSVENRLEMRHGALDDKLAGTQAHA